MFEVDPEPALEPVLNIEKNGMEDPRLTKMNGFYYLTYTAYDGDVARLCLAVSRDLKEWGRKGEMIPEWDGEKAQSFLLESDIAQANSKYTTRWNKAGGIFPEKLGGSFFMLFGDRHLWTACSTDGEVWQPNNEPLVRPRPGRFDSAHVEMGPPPIKTEKGWLVLYHGIDDAHRYSVGLLILDLKDPRRILYRSDEPVFWPEAPYELSGLVDVLPGGLDGLQKMSDEEQASFLKEMEANGRMPKVVFVCGSVVVDGMLRIYYGAGDSVICTAEAELEKLLALARN
jgi:predicted GH43/DUF377 family glycosyl hydrolase